MRFIRVIYGELIIFLRYLILCRICIRLGLGISFMLIGKIHLVVIFILLFSSPQASDILSWGHGISSVAVLCILTSWFDFSFLALFLVSRKQLAQLHILRFSADTTWSFRIVNFSISSVALLLLTLYFFSFACPVSFVISFRFTFSIEQKHLTISFVKILAISHISD